MSIKMAYVIQKFTQISSNLGTSAAVLPHFARHYRTSIEMHEVSVVGKLGLQLASDARVQAFILQRNPSVTMTSKTMNTGLVTVLHISLCSVRSFLIIV